MALAQTITEELNVIDDLTWTVLNATPISPTSRPSMAGASLYAARATAGDERRGDDRDAEYAGGVGLPDRALTERRVASTYSRTMTGPKS